MKASKHAGRRLAVVMWMGVLVAAGMVGLGAGEDGTRTGDRRVFVSGGEADGGGGGTLAMEGPFAKGEVHRVTLRNLPAHRYVRVRAEVVLTGAWAGYEAGKHSNDRLVVTSGAGREGGAQRVLLDASFAGFAHQKQSFPDWHGVAESPGRTGAARANGRAEPQNGEAVYPLEIVMGHTGGELPLEFEVKLGMQALPRAEWGLARLEVSVMDGAPVPFNAAQARGLMEALKGNDAVAAARASLTLASMGEAVVPVLEAGTTSDHDAVWTAEVKAAIGDLADDRFETREAAQKKLIGMGPDVAPLCRAAVEGNGSEEAKARLTAILQRPKEPTMFQKRVGHVAAAIGTERAMALAKGLLPIQRELPTLETLQVQLGVTDNNEWAVFQPKLARLLNMTSKMQENPQFCEAMATRNSLPQMKELNELFAGHPPDADLKTGMMAVRNAGPKLGDFNKDASMDEWMKVQDDVKKISTVRQEARMVVAGLVW